MSEKGALKAPFLLSKFTQKKQEVISFPPC